uniref:Uncharacterized protein n=1 Tax=Arundo donax TaxID=35708 RepID=A0A0A9AFK2_ARUDO
MEGGGSARAAGWSRPPSMKRPRWCGGLEVEAVRRCSRVAEVVARWWVLLAVTGPPCLRRMAAGLLGPRWREAAPAARRGSGEVEERRGGRDGAWWRAVDEAELRGGGRDSVGSAGRHLQCSRSCSDSVFFTVGCKSYS